MASKALKPKESGKTPVQNYPEREARERFERAVDIAIVTKPMHKEGGKQGAREKGR